MRELRNPTMIDPSVQVIALVLSQILQRRRIYAEFFDFLSALVGLCLMNGDSANAWVDRVTSCAPRG